MKNILKNKTKYKFFTATRLIVLGFMLIILLGACLLLIPASTKSGKITFLEALFTSTSATCVTGLNVFDISDTFTAFGQVVILCLIQLGGLGFMSLTSFIYLSFSKRIGLTARLTMREDVSEGNLAHIKKLVTRILLLTFASELLGMALLSIGFAKYMPAGEAVWNGLFHSVSAFCNAGFDIVTLNVGQSLITFSSDPLILLTIAALIVVGGLGFMVVSDMWDSKTWSHYRLHTKIVLTVTFFLIIFGTLTIFALEFSNPKTMGNMSTGDKFLNSFFQSVTARTAGFNSIDIGQMTPASIVLLDFLMFIGASPGSTGGGIKTTTLFVLAVMVFSVVRQRKSAIVDKQNIGSKTVHKASAIFMLATSLMILSAFVLSITDGNNFTFNQLLFEQISAYATVGLSMGITAGLSVVGKIVIIINMFVGRVGVLTFFISLKSGKDTSSAKIIYPECSVEM